MRHPKDAGTLIPVTFGQPDGRAAEVLVNGQAAGRMERYQDTSFWTYDHNGTSLVGLHRDLRRQIQRHYRECQTAVPAAV